MKSSFSEKINVSLSGVCYIARCKAPQTDITTRRSVHIPAPMSAIIGRVLHGNWLINSYSNTDAAAASSIKLTAARGRRLVAIHLDEKEEVSFKIHNLVFWTSRIAIRTRINLSMRHLACKMAFVQVATGPGTIILEVSGDPCLSDNHGTFLPPSRLIAWSADALFKIEKVSTILDLYFNEPQLQLISESACIIDSDDGEHRGTRNLFAFIKRLYVP